MPMSMSRKQKKAYYKRLYDKFYAAEYQKHQAKIFKDIRTKRVAEIKKKAREDAAARFQSKTARLKRGAARIQKGAARIQKKRNELASIVQPYYTNLSERMGSPGKFTGANMFDFDIYQKQKRKR